MGGEAGGYTPKWFGAWHLVPAPIQRAADPEVAGLGEMVKAQPGTAVMADPHRRHRIVRLGTLKAVHVSPFSR
jgi:hypothetical protein